MKSVAIRIVQQSLVDEGYNPGKVDGKLGANTYGAVIEALLKWQNELPQDWQSWPNSRKTTAYLQLLCREHNIDVGKIDGQWGPQTDYAFDTLSELLSKGKMPSPWRDDSPIVANPNNWPIQNEADLNAFYGAVGENQVKLTLPYPHRLSWDLRQTINSFSCNAKVHDSAKRILTKVLDRYGIERIRELRLDRWGGCLNIRKMRGGGNMSTHSWGIAMDYDPERNQLKWGRSQAAFAQAEYDDWWNCWEEEGWVSLGRIKNYDWMHVQAAKV